MRASCSCPYEVPGNRHIYNQFIIRVPRRDELQAHLAQQKIGHESTIPSHCICRSVSPISATARAISPKAKPPPAKPSPCRFIPNCPTSRPNAWSSASGSF